MTTLTLIGKDGCHLCDVARGVIEHVLADLPEAIADTVTVDEKSIHDDPALHAAWWEKIPVILIDGEPHAHWRVNPDRLRTAVLESTDARTRGALR
ncbi:glutaredoxin family protein [Microbacterium sp. NPDC089189]|uniref:glutaredoxin family protein n=1 Tax=Microbacterium sp. NPDC089189 TaxID=3154972 RepID=UPI0034198BA2